MLKINEVSVPYRGCFVFNFGNGSVVQLSRTEFPSPIGDVLFLIERFKMTKNLYSFRPLSGMFCF